MNDGDLAAIEVAHRHKGERSAGELNFHHARRGPERRQWFGRAENVYEPTADCFCFQRRSRDERAVRIVDEHVVQGGDDDAIRVGDEQVAVGRARPAWEHGIKLVLQAPIEISPAAAGAIDTLGENVGAGFELSGEVVDRLTAVVETLNEGAYANGEEEGDDQRRH